MQLCSDMTQARADSAFHLGDRAVAGQATGVLSNISHDVELYKFYFQCQPVSR